MVVTVRLFGTLSARFHEYDTAVGMKVDLPEGATVANLLNQLGLSFAEAGVAIVEGKPQRTDTNLQEGAQVYLFNTVLGG
jgi:sulfur carrier protein ThiS